MPDAAVAPNDGSSFKALSPVAGVGSPTVPVLDYKESKHDRGQRRMNVENALSEFFDSVAQTLSESESALIRFATIASCRKDLRLRLSGNLSHRDNTSGASCAEMSRWMAFTIWVAFKVSVWSK